MANDWPLSLRTAEVANVLGEGCENRMIRNNQILADVAVGRDDAIHAHGLKGSLGAGAPGDPTHEHDISVGRVLDRFGADVGNEVEQIDDAFGILLGPTDRTRGLWPAVRDVRQGNRGHPGPRTAPLRGRRLTPEN